MRVLLDEQLPRQLAPHLTGHDVRTVQQQEWKGLKNGELLKRAQKAGFDAFVTGDQSLQFQQSISSFTLGVITLRAASNALEDLLPLVPSLLETLSVLRPGHAVRVSAF